MVSVMQQTTESLKACFAWLDRADDDVRGMVERLVAEGQEHLFSGWDQPGVADGRKHDFLKSLKRIDGAYPGGLVAYIHNARKLLADSREGKNPFEGFVPEKPEAIDLTEFSASYDRYEATGVGHAHKTGVVLVAGGLGERLGYDGIKLDIPVEVTEGTTYLQHYASCIRAMEARMTNKRAMPFIIMTSEDTHAATLATLEKHDWFGLQREQVHILKQELVPAIANNDGQLALEERYQLVLKPHGHGDIHMLLHTSGLAAKLHADCIEHLVFIQDTNGQVFNVVPAALGVSVEKGYDFNSIAVPRIPGEAAGGLATLVKGDTRLTLNVEYNQLDPMLRATVNPEGDVPDERGYSVFPGNINVLIIKLASYVQILERSRGIIAEFVNPKYADAERTTFKKPTRLETMMQDLPKLFGAEERVGVTVFERRWAFSANKNNVVDAAAKAAAGGPPESAASAESDFYLAGRIRLREAGMKVEEAKETEICGVPVVPGPRVIVRPSFALTLHEVRQKVRGGFISGESTLVLDGRDIQLENVTLAGNAALVIRAVEGAKVLVKNLRVDNSGYALSRLSGEELQSSAVPEYLRIRGYDLKEEGALAYVFDVPGDYTIGGDGKVVEQRTS
jgi:UDP-sugar pyrophosphorylase